MNYIKHSALSFLNKNNLKGSKITFNRLQKAARQNGYLVKKYSTSYIWIIQLGLFERVKNSSSVSVKDENNNVIIFYDDSMPASKQLFVLAHEIGHIQLEHKPDKTHKNKQEREADYFAHYLLTGRIPFFLINLQY